MKYLLFYPVAFFLSTTSLTATNYYWIGGGGNWSDISHWATASGGVITHDQVPTANDDVFFDANSFTGPNQVVTINNDHILCKNLDWTGAGGNPAFRGDAGKVINIFGSLTFIANMVVDFSGEFRFLSPVKDTPIDFAGHRLGKTVLFDGAGGWILQDSLVVDSIILYKNGVLNTNSQNLHADYFRVDNQDKGHLIFGNSRITLDGRNTYRTVGLDFFVVFVLDFITWGNFTVDAGQSLIELTADDVTFRMQIGKDPVRFNDLYFSNPKGSVRMNFPWQFVGFGQVRFNGHGTMDNMGARRLILSPAKEYRFQSGYTYPIDSITAAGNCLGTITIQGSENMNETAVFQSNGNQIELDFVNLKNITATGTSTFVANNSADLGNNRGWIINTRSVQNLYWVGGTGNWDDPAHWSLTSGGSGGACIPSGTDNVFFDRNSFSAPGQRVTINIDNAYCHDMDWTGAAYFPTFAGYDYLNIHLFGSLTMTGKMYNQYRGYLKFEARAVGKTITTGNMLVNKILFNGNGGEWTLQDSLKVETDVSLDAGTLNTNGQYVESTFMGSTYGGSFRKLVLGNTHWVIKHFPDANRDIWAIWVNNLEFDAGTSTIEFIGTGVNGHMEHFGNGDIAYHKVVFTNNDGYLINWESPRIQCSIKVLAFRKGGHIFNGFTIDSLQLEPGYTYFLKPGTTQTIQELVAQGNCNALVSLRSMAAGSPARIKAADNQSVQYLILRDIHSIGPGMLTALNSIDLGNNQGWTIDELSSRTLYWVGGTGNWADPAHWSLTSGGPGGQCIPTLRDDVIFNARSFTASVQKVQGRERNGYYCRNMTWEAGLPNPVFDVNRIFCHGSAVFSRNMNNQLGNFHMSGSGMETVRFNGQPFNDVYEDGDGRYTFLDGLTASQLLLQSGALNTNGQPLNLGRFQIDNEFSPFVLDLSSSYIRLTMPFDVIYPLEAAYGNNTVIHPGTSVIELTHPDAGALLSGGLNFNNLIFSGTNGSLSIHHPQNGSSLTNPVYINLLELGGDAVIEGFHNIDSLILAPGKFYQLQHNATQTVDEYLQILGNNCNPIQLFSTRPGEKATISMAAGVVNSDFVQMKDQVATGGLRFFAGVHSTNINNSNQGWIFESRPDFADTGFFGRDSSICRGAALSLSAYNYSSGETYRWSTGSTDKSISVTQAGTYWARVTFGNMCEIVDTINISMIEPAAVNLGPDTRFCQGDSLVLDATSAIPDVTYAWQDRSANPVFSVKAGGLFWVQLNRRGCLSSDTINIAVIDLPVVALGADRTLCDGESAVLDATATQASTYRWQDGSTRSSLLVNRTGVYTVAVTTNGCTAADEATVTFNPLPRFSLGADTSLCSGETLRFNLIGAGDSYKWQDGAATAHYSIDQDGGYWLSVSSAGCTFADTLLVSFAPSPDVELGRDVTVCEGESVTLEAAVSQSDDFSWQDGSKRTTLRVDKPGVYWLEAVLGKCRTRDSTTVTIQAAPDLGLADSLALCRGETLVLRPAVSAGKVVWQDGATTPEYEVKEEGIYSVTVDDGICISMDEVKVTLSSCNSIKVFVPNAFSPNDDGLNDLFIPNIDPDYQVLDYQLSVFDRWGSLVFQTKDPGAGWNGTARGREAGFGVYVYMLRFTYDDQGEPATRILSGDVSLLR